jgi:hypothetical protein
MHRFTLNINDKTKDNEKAKNYTHRPQKQVVSIPHVRAGAPAAP